MKPIAKVYGKTQHIPVRKNPASGFSGGTHAQSDGGRSGWLLVNRDPTTYFAKQYDYLSRHAETMDLQKVRAARRRERAEREQAPAQVAAEQRRREQNKANAEAHRSRLGRRMSYNDRVKRAVRGSRLRRSPEKFVPGPFGTNPRLERKGDARNYWLNWKEGEDAYANGDLFPRVRPETSVWAEIQKRKKSVSDFFPVDNNEADDDGAQGGYRRAVSPTDALGGGGDNDGGPLATPLPSGGEKGRVAHMSDKLMKATLGKIFERADATVHGHSPPAEVRHADAIPTGNVYEKGTHRPKMAFGHRVAEDAGRHGWALGHHNNQVKDGVIFGDTLLSVKNNTVVDHMHTGGAHIQRRAPTKTDLRNKMPPARLRVVHKGMSGNMAMAFGHRVAEDGGRHGWALGHHNNQVKDGVIFGDTLLSVKNNTVVDHMHTGGAHIQRRALTKTDLRNREQHQDTQRPADSPLTLKVAQVQEPEGFSFE